MAETINGCERQPLIWSWLRGLLSAAGREESSAARADGPAGAQLA